MDGFLSPVAQEAFFLRKEDADEFLFLKRRALDELHLVQLLPCRIEEVEVMAPPDKPPKSTSNTKVLFCATLPKNAAP